MTSLCLFYSLPKRDNILLPQGSTAMVSRSKMARRFRHFGDGNLKKATTDFSPYKMYPHRAAYPSSRSAAAAAAADPPPSRTGWGNQVPPPAEALHLSIQHCCMVLSTISHLSANCKALGDSENKAIHTQAFKNLTATVLLSENIPLLHARLNYMLKFYWLQGDIRICLTSIIPAICFTVTWIICLAFSCTALSSFHSRVLLLTHKWKSRYKLRQRLHF